MKKSRFSEDQIAYALRMSDGGTPVVDVCRQIGISEATFYTWKKKYGELGVSELRKLRQLEDENARLRRIVADLTLDKQILQEVVKKSSEGCQAPRAGSLDAGTFQGQRAPLVPTGAAAAFELVRQERGARSQRPASAHSTPRDEQAPVWLSACPGDAQTRALGGGREARVPVASPGRPTVAYEGQAPQAHRVAARQTAACNRAKPALEHGLCARPDARWTRVSHPHGHRSMESRECLPGGQLPAIRPVRCSGAGRGRQAPRLAHSDHR
jgi:putative transposase